MAMQVAEFGGPEILMPIDFDPGPPGAGQIRIRDTAIGVNFIDVAYRSGRYPIRLPIVPDLEGAGIVEAVGSDVADIRLGDRIASASALLFQGITVQGLIRSCYPLKAGDVRP